MNEFTPAVFAVNDTYQIMVPSSEPSLCSVIVNGVQYDDEVNGVLRSSVPVHRVTVPARELEQARAYTVKCTPMRERLPFYSVTGEPTETTYIFRPVPKINPRAYHITDCHSLVSEPIAAAKAYGAFDFLILNGDIVEYAQQDSDFLCIYHITTALTKGEIPVILTRGNHDVRGLAAECMNDYIPTDNGKVYYTFRLGGLWGVILDCGENKSDSNDECGHTAGFHAFRERETAFLRRTVAEKAYLNDEITHRLVISHNPFSYQRPKFAIVEPEIYGEWTDLCRKMNTDVMISGHTHHPCVSLPCGETDDTSQPFAVIVGGTPNDGFIGCGIEFLSDRIRVIYTSAPNTLHEEYEIMLERQ